MSSTGSDSRLNGDQWSPSYAVVVATRGRGAQIVPLLRSVVASDAADFEMIIVDQSTDDSTKVAIAPYLNDNRIRCLTSKSIGLSRARNLGISMTTAPIIAITDDDCIVPTNWLSTFGEAFERYPEVGVAFCSVKPVPVEAPGLTPHIIFERNFVVRDVQEQWRRSANGFVLGAGMAIRRAMFDELRGFDELLGAGARFGSSEDNDLSWRGLLRGWQVYLCADIAVMHDGFRSLKEVRALVTRDLYGVGGALAKYIRFKKWGAARLLLAISLRFGVVEPFKDLCDGRRPRGFRRPFILLHGVLDGMRTPINSNFLIYTLNTSVLPHVER